MAWIKLPPLKTESGEFLHLDALRFIAAMGIVAHHFREDWFGNAFAMQRLNGLNLFVDLFFAISGVVITFVYSTKINTVQDYGDFLKKRVARLGPLHWLTLLFFVVIAVAAARGWAPQSDHYDWNCLPWNAAMLHSAGVCHALSFNYVSWSISAEMIVYAMFPVFLFAFRKSGWAPFCFGVVVLAAMYAVRAPRPWWEWTYDFGVFRAVAGFCIGMGIYAARETLAKIIPAARFVLLASLVLFFVAMMLEVNNGVLVLGAYAIVAIGVAADGQKVTGHMGRLIAPLGSLTFGIYMIHPIVRTVLTTLIGQKILHLKGWALNAEIVFAVCVVLAAAYASKFAFEDPTRRWISALKRRRRRRIIHA